MCLLTQTVLKSVGHEQGWVEMPYCNLLLFPVTSKVRDYNCQNSNYITVTDASDSVVTVLLERAVYMLALAALLMSDKNICPLYYKVDEVLGAGKTGCVSQGSKSNIIK